MKKRIDKVNSPRMLEVIQIKEPEKAESTASLSMHTYARRGIGRVLCPPNINEIRQLTESLAA